MCLCPSDHVPPLRVADRVAGGKATEQFLGTLFVSGVVIHRSILAFLARMAAAGGAIRCERGPWASRPAPDAAPRRTKYHGAGAVPRSKRIPARSISVADSPIMSRKVSLKCDGVAKPASMAARVRSWPATALRTVPIMRLHR